jgi:hypothetical protein
VLWRVPNPTASADVIVASAAGALSVDDAAPDVAFHALVHVCPAFQAHSGLIGA